MALLIDDEEVEKRLNHPENAVIKFSGPGPQPGVSHPRHRFLKPDTKAFIGTCAKLDSVSNTARVFQMRPAQVSNIKNGAEQTKTNQEVQDKIDSNLKSVRDIAIDKLMISMLNISEDKLKMANPLIAASIAEKMASIHDKLSPKGPQVLNQSQIVYYVPRPREEKEYPIIETEAIGS